MKEKPETPKAPAEDESLLSSGAVAQGGLHTGIRVSCTLSGKRTSELEHLSSPFGALEHSQARCNPTGPRLDVGRLQPLLPRAKGAEVLLTDPLSQGASLHFCGETPPSSGQTIKCFSKTNRTFIRSVHYFIHSFCQSFTSLGNKDALLRALLLGMS